MAELFEIENELQRGVPRPVYVLVGSEALLIDRAVDAIRDVTVTSPIAGINYDVYQGRGTLAHNVIQSARTVPMLSDKRFILIRNSDEVATDELEKFVEYMKAPCGSACLVMLWSKLDTRLKFGKAAKAAGIVYEAGELKAHQVSGFVQNECNRMHVKIDERARHAIADAIGTDLSLLGDALERLTLYADGEPISEAMVHATIVHSRVDSIWLLVDAISQKKKKAALTTTGSLLADREPALKILAMVTRQLKMVTKMRHALNAGQNPAAAAKEAGVPPFKAAEMAASAKRFGDADLARAFALLLDADLALKGSKRASEHILEDTVLRLCS